MTPIPLAFAAVLLAGTALAQGTASSSTGPGAGSASSTTATSPRVNPSTGTQPDAGLVERNRGTAAASGNRNQAVATTDAKALQPARGANSFSQGQAQSRMQDNGFQNVSGLKKDSNGVWRGTATKDGRQVAVWLDYKGNVGQGNAPVPASASTRTRADHTADRTLGTTTSGNPPGTTASRATDRALGTNMSGTNPGANRPDGTPGNPPGTAASRTIDRSLDTNLSGANPGGSNTAR